MKNPLDRIQHLNPKRPQYATRTWSVSDYEKILQMVPNPDESDIIDRKATTIIQYIVGTMLYYAQLVDPNMLRAIDEILRVQSRPTQDTEEKARMLIYYVTTYPTEILHYKARDMVLHMDSDLAYLAMPKARSC